MSAHDHTRIVPGCYRCDLNKDEMPTPLEAAAAVIYDGPASFPSDTTTAREAIEAALDAAGIAEVLSSASWPDGGHDGFPTKRVAEMLADAVRTALLGPTS